MILLTASKAAAAQSNRAGQLKSRYLLAFAAWFRQLNCVYCQHVNIECRGNRCFAVIWHNTAAGRPHHGLCYRQCQPPSHCCWYAPQQVHGQVYAIMTLSLLTASTQIDQQTPHDACATAAHNKVSFLVLCLLRLPF